MSKAVKIRDVALQKKKIKLDINGLSSSEVERFICIEKTPYLIPEDVSSVEKFYLEGGRVLMYADGMLYEHNGDEFLPILNPFWPTAPKVFAMKHDYKDDLLVVAENSAEFITGYEVNVPYCEVISVCFGMLFRAEGRHLYLLKDFGLEDGVQVVTRALCFQTELDDGKITGVIEYGDCVLVLCEHKIIKLSFTKDPGDVVVERLLTPYFTSKTNTLAVCGDKALFLANEGLAIFEGNTLTFTELPLSVTIENIFDNVSSNGALYIIPFTYGEEKRICVYDANCQKFNDVLRSTFALSKNGGLFLNEDNEICKIVVGKKVQEQSKILGVKTEIDGCGKKLLLKIEIHATGSATLNVLSSAGERKFLIKEGCNEINLNLCSRQFTFSFTDRSENFFAEETTLTYAKLGG